MGTPRTRTIALAVGLVSFLVYNANLHVVGCHDSYPGRYLPLSIWKSGHIDFEAIYGPAALQRFPDPYWMFPARDGRRGSIFPIVTPVLITPLYAPAVAYLHARDWNYPDVERVARIMDKVSASIVTSLAVAIMFLVIRRRLPLGESLLLTATFAFGTSTWSTSSQSLWMHAVAELCGAVALWALTAEATRMRAIIAGVAIALLVANRPPDVFLGAALGIYGLYWARRKAVVSLIAAVLVPGLLVVAYNVNMFGHPLGAWGTTPGFQSTAFFKYSVLEGIGGLLISPGRGLFVFSPVLLFLPFLIHRVFRDRAHRFLAICLLTGIAAQIVFYARANWTMGHSYGSRYMVDAVPFLVWMMIPVVASLHRASRLLFAALLLISIAIQYIGAFHYNAASNVIYFSQARLESTEQFWKIRNVGFVIEARNPRAPADLLDPVPTLQPSELRTRELGTFVPLLQGCTLIDTHTIDGFPLLDAHGRHMFLGYRIFTVERCGVPTSAVSVTGFLTTSEAKSPGHLFVASNMGGPWRKFDALAAPRTTGPITLPVKYGQMRAFAALKKRGSVHVRFEATGYRALISHPPLSDSAFRVRWSTHTMPSRVAAGSTFPVRIQFTNIGDATWPDPAMGNPELINGGYAVRLSHAWYPAGADLTTRDGLRTDLSAPLAPGETATLTVTVTAPNAPGDYRVVFELVQELVAWFDTKGASQLEVPVTVD